jgi:hypothetical protein
MARKNYSEKVRECLKCGRKFKSGWAGNRICKKCKNVRRQTRSYRMDLPPQFITINGNKVQARHGR